MSCVVCPSTMVSSCGVTSSVAIGTGITVTPTTVLRDSLVAVMVATPGEIPVTRPFTSTTAVVGSLVLQNTERAARSPPLSSRVRAVSCTNPPTRRLAGDGVTTTEATGRVTTVTTAVALRPPALAAMVVMPSFNAVTTPVWDTPAIRVSLLDQKTSGLAMVPALASRTVTCSTALPPSTTANCSGFNSIAATDGPSGFGAVMSPRPLQPTMPPPITSTAVTFAQNLHDPASANMLLLSPHTCP